MVYYNLIREHQGIGNTHARAAGICLNLGHDFTKHLLYFYKVDILLPLIVC
jgi:hypothetical protein